MVIAPGAGTSAPVRVEDQYSVQQPAAGSDRNAALRSALHAGVIAAVLSLLPFGFILALPLAGFLCVLLYRRRAGMAEPSPGAGFRLGALTGLFGFAIFAVLWAVEVVVSRGGSELRGMMMEKLQHAQASNPDPQARQMFDYLMSPQGLVFMMVFGFIFMCIAFVLLSGLGGAISARLLRRKGPPV